MEQNRTDFNGNKKEEKRRRRDINRLEGNGHSTEVVDNEKRDRHKNEGLEVRRRMGGRGNRYEQDKQNTEEEHY